MPHHHFRASLDPAATCDLTLTTIRPKADGLFATCSFIYVYMIDKTTLLFEVAMNTLVGWHEYCLWLLGLLLVCEDVRSFIFEVLFTKLTDKASALVEELSPCLSNVSRRLNKDMAATKEAE
eukprot:3280396-Amphidinium_carterae.1